MHIEDDFQYDQQDQRRDGSSQGNDEPSSQNDGEVHQDDPPIGGILLFFQRGMAKLLFPNEVVKEGDSVTQANNQKCWPDIHDVRSQEICRREKPGEPPTVGRHLLIGQEEGEDKAQVSGHEGAIVHDKKRHHENVPDIGDDHHLEDVVKTDNSALQPKTEYDGE